ncbi:hypothetical protein M9Y10_041951 [Tritrichomonas musculus]|uniref:Rad60/SUMO-like domain-containing protein n=1 Tax=Tritrichomonas musculus TaxID=1915356 RepID=A0ABR2K6N8_9EUKA
MTDSHQSVPTISTPFIYLKLKSIKDSMQRKIAYPTSFTQLLNTAARIYRDTINVQSLFTDEGILIESLNDISPGSVILCSELLPNEINQTKNKSSGMSTPKKKTSSVMSKTSFSRIFGNIGDSPVLADFTNGNYVKGDETNSGKRDVKYFNSTRRDGANSGKRDGSFFNQNNSNKRDTTNAGRRDGSYYNTSNSGKRESTNPFLSARHEMNNPSSQGKSRKKLSPDKKSDNAPSSVSAAKQARMKENRMNALRQRLSLTPQSKLPEQIEESSSPSPVKQQYNQATGTYSSGKKQLSLHRSENLSPNSPNYNNQIEEDSGPGKTEEEIEEVNNSKVHDMLSKILNGVLIQSDSREALMSMNDLIRPFIAHLPDLESEQQSRWFSKGIEIIQSFGFPEVNESLLGYDSIIGVVRSIIVDHRFNKKGGSLHRFNIAITGPKKSGKSTFLSIFIQELFLELITTDHWKEYFIFALDMEKVAEMGNDIESLYIYMVNATFKQLEFQCPNSSQYFPMITKYFESVTSLRNPPQFSKPFRESEQTHSLAIQLQKIADQLSDAWNNMDNFNQFITNITMFPKMMADIFEFKHQIVIFDNFEACDIFIEPSPPFSTETENFQFATLIVFLLNNNDFIISCRNHTYLTNLVLCSGASPPVLDFVSTLDVSIDDVYSKYQFNATIDDENIPLTIEHCGGIPSYVHSWISLNEFYTQAIKAQGKKENEEAELFIIERVEELMRLLYASDNNEEIHVESVTRTKET